MFSSTKNGISASEQPLKVNLLNLNTFFGNTKARKNFIEHSQKGKEHLRVGLLDIDQKILSKEQEEKNTSKQRAGGSNERKTRH